MEPDSTLGAHRESALRSLLATYGRAMVAFSGGVDSTYLLDVSHEVLAQGVVAVTADSPSLARESLVEAQEFCRGRGITHHVIPTDEFTRPEYQANDGRRCYHCKSALLEVMGRLSVSMTGPSASYAMLIGAISEDFTDVRPGLVAAAEAGAHWPLAEVGFTKPEVRARSRARGLPTWNRPAEPCLSSRIPYGETVTPEAVTMIGAAEAFLRQAGLRECRARHHRVGDGRGWLCRIEVPESDLPLVLAQRTGIVAALRAIGYGQVALDLAGLRSGGFNDLLRQDERP